MLGEVSELTFFSISNTQKSFRILNEKTGQCKIKIEFIDVSAKVEVLSFVMEKISWKFFEDFSRQSCAQRVLTLLHVTCLQIKLHSKGINFALTLWTLTPSANKLPTYPWRKTFRQLSARTCRTILNLNFISGPKIVELQPTTLSNDKKRFDWCLRGIFFKVEVKPLWH